MVRARESSPGTSRLVARCHTHWSTEPPIIYYKLFFIFVFQTIVKNRNTKRLKTCPIRLLFTPEIGERGLPIGEALSRKKIS